MADHLYATWAMARLLGGAGQGDRNVLNDSVNRALRYAAGHVKRAGQPSRTHAYVATPSPRNQLAATALLVLALDKAPPSKPGAQLQKDLLASLVGAIGKDGRLPGRLDAGGATESEQPEASLAHAALACLAFEVALPDSPPEAAKVAEFRKALVARAAAHRYPADVCTTLWWVRAGLAIPAVPVSAAPRLRGTKRSATRAAGTVFPLPVRAGASGPPLRDEVGGFGPAGQAPTTAITALTALQLRTQLAGRRKRPVGQARELQRQLLEARRFCYQMMFKPYEAYFAPEPEAWVGAVRTWPGSAAVSLRACAAAIEAFLAK